MVTQYGHLVIRTSMECENDVYDKCTEVLVYASCGSVLFKC